MHVSAKADYAVRAAIELAAAVAGPVKGDRIAEAQQIPLKFLENILSDLRHAGYVQSQRGAEGGYWLAEPAHTITLADIIRAVDGPLANVRGVRPESVEYAGSASHLVEVWIAVRVALRSVLERVTLADLVAGVLPAEVKELIAAADPPPARPVQAQLDRPARPARDPGVTGSRRIGHRGETARHPHRDPSRPHCPHTPDHRSSGGHHAPVPPLRGHRSRPARRRPPAGPGRCRRPRLLNPAPGGRARSGRLAQAGRPAGRPPRRLRPGRLPDRRPHALVLGPVRAGGADGRLRRPAHPARVGVPGGRPAGRDRRRRPPGPEDHPTPARLPS